MQKGEYTVHNTKLGQVLAGTLTLAKRIITADATAHLNACRISSRSYPGVPNGGVDMATTRLTYRAYVALSNGAAANSDVQYHNL
jgi:hypothetical protein